MMAEMEEEEIKLDDSAAGDSSDQKEEDEATSASSASTVTVIVDVCKNNNSDENEQNNCISSTNGGSKTSPTTGNVENLLNELDGLLHDEDDLKMHASSSADFNSTNSLSTNGVRSDLGIVDSSVDKMSKFYEKYSLQCQEIEKLEKMVQHLQEQCSAAIRDKDAYLNQIRDLNKNHSSKVQELEKRITDGDTQMKILKDRSTAQENHFRKTLQEQETKFNMHIEHLKKSTDQAHREKDNAVVKYAQREKEILTSEASLRKCQQQVSQLNTERDALSSRLRAAKNEKEQLVQVLHQKENEGTDWKRKYEEIKNFIQESELRVKLADKKVEEVESAHKETKVELEKAVKKIKEAKEETLTIKANCQEMIKQYQDKEDKKKVEAEIQKQERTDQEEIYKMVLDELDALKKQHKSILCENEQKTEKLTTVERNLVTKENKLKELQIIIDSKDDVIGRLQNDLSEYKSKMHDLEIEKRRLEEEERKMSDLMCENLDLENDAVACRKNAESMLDLTQKLSDKNSQLQSENFSFSSKLSAIELENRELNQMCDSLKSKVALYEHELSTLKASTSGEINELNGKLTKAVEREQELNIFLEDERNQLRILKKKHAASLKELKNELSVLKRRLESYESGTASQCSGGSAGDDQDNLCSRSPSMTSLDTGVASGGTNVRHHAGVESPNDNQSIHSHQSSVNCEHNQAMIEKIVKLQRMLARRTEKIEFLEEHNKQLIGEMQKKSRIIQSYALREETGALTPESVDINKAQLAKKGQTVMGSVFGSGHSSELSNLTNDLSIQIMRKLQAVLEDALLKNITLKDNIETLGNEISKLSRENRSLGLKLQQIEKSS